MLKYHLCWYKNKLQKGGGFQNCNKVVIIFPVLKSSYSYPTILYDYCQLFHKICIHVIYSFYAPVIKRCGAHCFTCVCMFISLFISPHKVYMFCSLTSLYFFKLGSYYFTGYLHIYQKYAYYQDFYEFFSGVS